MEGRAIVSLTLEAYPGLHLERGQEIGVPGAATVDCEVSTK